MRQTRQFIKKSPRFEDSASVRPAAHATLEREAEVESAHPDIPARIQGNIPSLHQIKSPNARREVFRSIGQHYGNSYVARMASQIQRAPAKPKLTSAEKTQLKKIKNKLSAHADWLKGSTSTDETAAALQASLTTLFGTASIEQQKQALADLNTHKVALNHLLDSKTQALIASAKTQAVSAKDAMPTLIRDVAGRLALYKDAIDAALAANPGPDNGIVELIIKMKSGGVFWNVNGDKHGLMGVAASAGLNWINPQANINAGVGAVATTKTNADTGADGTTLSAASVWDAKPEFRASKDLATLKPDFKSNVEEFQGSLKDAGANYTVNETRRFPSRTYLLYWCVRVAKTNTNTSAVSEYITLAKEQLKNEGTNSPGEVTIRARAADLQRLAEYPDVPIKWSHPTEAQTKAGAEAMRAVGNYSVVAPPGKSNHIDGNALDMNVSWSGNISIKKKGAGVKTLINTDPRRFSKSEGLKNEQMIEVGRTYGVINYGGGDEIHWSKTGG